MTSPGKGIKTTPKLKRTRRKSSRNISQRDLTSLRSAIRTPIEEKRLTTSARNWKDESKRLWQGKLQSRSAQKALFRCTLALRELRNAVRLKRLALLIAAHLLTNNTPAIAEINWLYRFLVRDGHVVEEQAMASRHGLQKGTSTFVMSDTNYDGTLDLSEFTRLIKAWKGGPGSLDDALAALRSGAGAFGGGGGGAMSSGRGC